MPILKNKKSKTKKYRYPNRLRKYRKIMQLKQNEVAKDIGLSSSNRLSRWENGISLPSVENLFKLGIRYRTLVETFYPDMIERLRSEILQVNDPLNHYENSIY